MTFTRTAELPVSPDEAFALITDPERLRRWQAVSAYVDLRAGGDYRFTVLPGHTAAGTYREVDPGRRIVFGWGWEGNPELPPDRSTVTVTVEPSEGGSRVTLVHEGLDAEQELSHAEGWNHFLDRLERLAATGDAGPDEWAGVPESLDPFVASEAVLAALQPVLRGVTPDDRGKATPCANYTCHELVEHLVESLVQLGVMSGAAVSADSDGSLENRISTLSARVIDGWRVRGTAGAVPGPGGREMPADFIASILPLELALHGWDLAQATSQGLRLSDQVVSYLRELADSVVPAGRGRSFGAEAEPALGADALDKLAAFAGRRPLACSAQTGNPERQAGNPERSEAAGH